MQQMELDYCSTDGAGLLFKVGSVCEGNLKVTATSPQMLRMQSIYAEKEAGDSCSSFSTPFAEHQTKSPQGNEAVNHGAVGEEES
jgi:hypothetical protein